MHLTFHMFIWYHFHLFFVSLISIPFLSSNIVIVMKNQRKRMETRRKHRKSYLKTFRNEWKMQ